MAMKRAFFAIVLTVVLAGSSAYAEPAAPLSNSQQAQIRQNCSRIKTTLARIHANDGLLRVNQGQQYETIATKLMAPLNSRIALNQLDGVDMAKTTVDYNAQLSKFRTEYRQYEERLSALLRADCKKNPTEFYSLIKPARDYRERVSVTTTKLNQLIDQYQTQLDAFYLKQFPEKKEVHDATSS